MNQEKINRAFQELLGEFLKLRKKENDNTIPVGISNRHIHLSEEDFNILFGKDYELKKVKDLSQTGQFAAAETCTIVGPRGAIEKVRILGPLRKETQVEILMGDSFKLGVKGSLRMSGDLEGTNGVTIVGPQGSVQIKKGLIVAKRHIHMLPEDAKIFNVTNNQIVKIKLDGERGGILENVVVRVTNSSKLECHLDTEEANAFGLNSKSRITIL